MYLRVFLKAVFAPLAMATVLTLLSNQAEAFDFSGFFGWGGHGGEGHGGHEHGGHGHGGQGHGGGNSSGASVPEIGAGTASAALALLLGGAFILKDRFFGKRVAKTTK